MQLNEKSSLKKAIAPLASVLVLLILFGFAAFDIIGLKLFVALFSLYGMAWAILGVTHPDWIVGRDKTPEQITKDREAIVFRSRLLFIVCTLILILIFLSRHDWLEPTQ